MTRNFKRDFPRLSNFSARCTLAQHSLVRFTSNKVENVENSIAGALNVFFFLIFINKQFFELIFMRKN